MSFHDKFHINPANGAVDKCRAKMGECPFGSYDQHFNDRRTAQNVAERKLQQFHDWTSRSRVPQEPGWHTEEIFDPSRPETTELCTIVLRGPLPAGTRLVMENGWELVRDGLTSGWYFTKGEDTRFMFSLEKDIANPVTNFSGVLMEVGGRLEFQEGTKPMHINWR